MKMIINGVELVEIQPDDRRYCEDCRHHKSYDWKGLCSVGQPMMRSILNRCGSYQDKHVIKSNVWHTGDKPFWE